MIVKSLLALAIILTFNSCGNRHSAADERQYEERYAKVQNAVSNWIRKYALYPDSYESVSFSEYSEAVSKVHDEMIPNSENYFIKHTHRLLNKDSIMTTFTGYFILEYDFSVNIIEIKRSKSIGGAFPPRTRVWMDKYGRLLNRQDSIELEQQQQQVNEKFINDLKRGLEEGDAYTPSPKDKDKLKNLLDTLDRKK